MGEREKNPTFCILFRHDGLFFSYVRPVNSDLNLPHSFLKKLPEISGSLPVTFGEWKEIFNITRLTIEVKATLHRLETL